jgi:hypothetical protein
VGDQVLSESHRARVRGDKHKREHLEALLDHVRHYRGGRRGAEEWCPPRAGGGVAGQGTMAGIQIDDPEVLPSSQA